MITRYIVVTSDNAIALAIEIQKHLDQGWLPQGGVCMQVWQSQASVGNGLVNHVEYAQALVKSDACHLHVGAEVTVHGDMNVIKAQVNEALHDALRRAW